ncbi:MAG: hypothetical protein ACT452_18990 [Microthrixaceae bacterium]
MSPPRFRAAAALVAVTFVIWTTRIGNIWADPDLSDGEKWGRTALALSFTVLAATVVAALVRRAAWGPTAVLVLAGWTIGVWATRSVGLVRGDHDAAFVAVHLALAIVSCALSAAALWERHGNMSHDHRVRTPLGG